jgi:AbrB family looped-hinge helix DNA binding protein
MKSTIDRAGRVVIPKAIREAAGLKPGASLKIKYRNGRVEIEPESPKMRLVRKGSVLVASAPGTPKVSLEEVSEWIRKSRDGGNLARRGNQLRVALDSAI